MTPASGSAAGSLMWTNVGFHSDVDSVFVLRCKYSSLYSFYSQSLCVVVFIFDKSSLVFFRRFLELLDQIKAFVYSPGLFIFV